LVSLQAGVVHVRHAKVRSGAIVAVAKDGRVTGAATLAVIGNSEAQKFGPHEWKQKSALSFASAFRGNFLAGTSCGFSSVKRKLFRLGSALKK
jgi:hypothetical protein